MCSVQFKNPVCFFNLFYFLFLRLDLFSSRTMCFLINCDFFTLGFVQFSSRIMCFCCHFYVSICPGKFSSTTIYIYICVYIYEIMF